MNSILRTTRKPDVTFYKSGRIDITARVAMLLRLAEGDIIDVATEKGEYFLYVKHRASEIVGKHEASVHPTNHGKTRANNYRAYSKTLTSAIYNVSRCEDENARIAAGDCVQIEGIGAALPLITRRLL